MHKFNVPTNKFDILPLQTVTPEMCIEWRDGGFLMHNPRGQTQSQIDKIAQSIRNDTFDPETGNTIEFNKEGYIQDGAHRVFGVIKADKPVLLNVVLGATVRHLHNNDPRKMNGGQLWARQLQLTRDDAPMCQRKLSIAQEWLRQGIHGPNYRPDTEELIGFYNTHRAAIDFASPYGKNPTAQSVGCRAAFAFYFSLHPSRARAFFVQVTGNEEFAPTNPAQALRDWFNDCKSQGRNAGSKRYEATAAAIHYFHKGRRVSYKGLPPFRGTWEL